MVTTGRCNNFHTNYDKRIEKKQLVKNNTCKHEF